AAPPATAARPTPDATQPPALQFQGALDLLHVDLRQTMDFFGPRPVPDQVHGAANLQSHIRLVPGMSGYDMVLSDMKTTVENLSIAGQASLSGIMTRQSTFAVTISATPVSLDELLSRFPAQWLPPHLQSLLTEREIKGTVEVVTATVTGSTTPTPHASVTGEFRLQQGHALLGRNKVPAKNLAGTVLLDPDRLRAADITGEYGPLQLTAGKLAIAFLDQGPSLDLDVSGTLPAADLVTVLATSIESQTVSKTLAQLHEVKGRTHVTFRLSGLLNQPDGLTFSGAEIALQDVSLKSPALPEAVTGLTGRLAYSHAALELDRVGGNLGQAQFQLHGTITTKIPAQFQGFSVWAQAPANQILSLVSRRAPDNTTVQGPLGIALSLAGPVAAPQMKGVIEFNDASVTIPSVLHKPAGQPAALEFDAALSRDRTLTAARFDFIMPPVRLSGKGTVTFGTPITFKGSLISGPIPLAGLPPGMTLGNIDAGTLEISLDFRGKGAQWKSWVVTGWVALTDGLLASKKFETPLTDIYLRVQLLRNGADLKRLEFRIKDNFVRLSGMIRNWHTKPALDLKVESPELDLGLLIPKGERSPVRDILEDLAARGRLTASVAITLGQYKQLTINDLSGRVNIGDEVLDINQIAGQIGEGTLDGRLVVRLPKRKPAEAEVKVQLTSVPWEKIIPLFDDKQRIVATGDLFLAATVQGNGRNPLGVANTLNGTVEYQIKNSRIMKGVVIPRILTILDIPSRLQGKLDLSGEGIPIDKHSATVTIRNGIATTDNLLIDSPVVKIAMAGSYDIPTDQLNMEAVVSPFGSYTKLLQSIPLFGKLFKGERQGFTTAFLDIKGSFAEPRIESHPIKSLGAGLTGLAHLAADVLINTLKLPVEMISPSDEKPAPPVSERMTETRPPAGQPAPATP
ncbi:MAG: AsmA-like C-terminal domain-containing protein, partial [Nitrospirota bacterium]